MTQVGLTEKEEFEANKEESGNNNYEENEYEEYDDEDDEDEDWDGEEEATEISVEGLGVGQDAETSSVFNIPDIRGNNVEISENDLNVHVFSPYIKSITDYILAKDEENNNEAKIFLSGNYSSDANFFEQLTTVKEKKFENFIEFVDGNGVDVVSLGAVSFGLRLHDLQTPFFKPETPLTLEEIKEKKMREDERNKNYKKEEEKPIDFVVGIGK